MVQIGSIEYRVESRDLRDKDGYSLEELVEMLALIRKHERIQGWKVPEPDVYFFCVEPVHRCRCILRSHGWADRRLSRPCDLRLTSVPARPPPPFFSTTIAGTESRTMADGWNSGRLILALAQHFQWWRQHMFTEYEVDGGRADLIFLTPSGYLTEVEIKISVADWNADRNKLKFDRERPHVSRFFYAFPETIQDKIPTWVPDHAGLIVVGKSSSSNPSWRHDWTHEKRPAVRHKAKKLSDEAIQRMHQNMYHRFWQQEIRRLRYVIYDRPRMKLMAEGR